MLVITRQAGENIFVCDVEGNILATVCVLQILSKQNVKIGIDAPKHVKLYREEVFEKMRKEEEETATLLRKLMDPSEHDKGVSKK